MNVGRLTSACWLLFGVSCVASSGGVSNPGADDAGSGSGGRTATGGSGVASGGATGSGGAVVGASGGRGTATGGTNGIGTGGRATGGISLAGTGGRGTGGAGTGGRATGGAGGAGDWLTGYTATMFGNTTAGDCNAVANFTDATNISGATCTRQGVTLAPFSAGTANNSSFYAAPGDLSSIWMGPTCVCPAGATTNAAGLCSRAPSCPMEAVCGRCFEVRCDPMGTGTYSDGATRVGAMYCNPNQTAVVQIIDACPHNHPNNPWWCTTQRQNHIDISCSAMRAIAGNPNNVGSWGWLNVQVRPVDCAVGLGAKMP